MKKSLKTRKLYNQVRRYWWREDEYSMPLIARFGTGGGNMPIILESKLVEDLKPDLTMEEADNMDDDRGTGTLVTDGNRTGDCMVSYSIVRRLTPTECCRLQGFPDSWVDLGDWTDEDNKKHKEADTPKFKALGNSIAVGFQNNRSGFWCWLMRRISAQYEYRPTQGSLFSGIGGFDLAWAAVNGPESCRWSSEIEQFPIAVMKKHFGDEDTGEEGDFYRAINGG